MMQSFPELTQGYIYKIMVCKDKTPDGILQIIQIKEFPSQSTYKKYRIALSDGEYYTPALINNQLNVLVESGEIKNYSIVVLRSFNLIPTRDKELLIASGIKLVSQISHIVGNPKSISTISQHNSQVILEEKAPSLPETNQPPQNPISNHSITNIYQPSLENPPTSGNQTATDDHQNKTIKDSSNLNNPADSDLSYLNSNSDLSQHVLTPPLQNDSATRKYNQSSQQQISTFFNATQKTARKHSYYSIDILNPYMRTWSILARVVMKGTTFNYVGRDGKPGKILNITLKDRSKSEIRGTFFNDQVDIFDPIIEQDKVYQVSGGLIKPKNPRFNTTDHDYEISFDSTTKFLPMPDDSTIEKLTWHFRKLAELPNVPPKTSVDVIGYVVSISELQSLSIKDKTVEKRELVLCDDSNVKCEMTVWDKDAHNLPSEGGIIVAFKDAKVSDFKGRTLSSPSYISVRPDMQPAYSIQRWIEQSLSNPNFDFNKMETVSNGGDATRSYIYLSQIDELHLGTHEKPDYGTAIVILSDVMLNRRLYYAACPNPDCKFKGLSLTNDQSYICSKCQRIVDKPVYRYNFAIKVQDFTGSTIMNFLGDDQTGSLFTGMSAEEWHDKTENMEEAEVRALIQDKFFTPLKVRCRMKTDQYNGKNLVKTSIFSAQLLDFAEGARFFANEINKYS